VRSSLPKVVDPEIAEPVTWQLNFFRALRGLGTLHRPLGEIRGQSLARQFLQMRRREARIRTGVPGRRSMFLISIPRAVLAQSVFNEDARTSILVSGAGVFLPLRAAGARGRADAGHLLD
jgi:hypothetical protein